MRPQRTNQFLTRLERRAASHGITASVNRIGRRAHYSVTLVSQTTVGRIVFVLGAKQEISPATCRAMLSIVQRYLANEDISDEEERFGTAARATILEALHAAGAEVSGTAAIAAARPSDAPAGQDAPLDTGAYEMGQAARLPLRGSDAQRAWFLANFTCLSAAQVADLGIAPDGADAGDSTFEPSLLLLRIEHGAHALYPDFQFSGGKPRPVVADVLRVLQGLRSDWQIAFWFIAANSWLNGQRPIDRLDDRETVVAAAIQHVNALVA